MASLCLCPQFETNLMSNRKVIDLLLQLKSAKAHVKNYIKVKLHLVRHLLRNRLLLLMFSYPKYLEQVYLLEENVPVPTRIGLTSEIHSRTTIRQS